MYWLYRLFNVPSTYWQLTSVTKMQSVVLQDDQLLEDSKTLGDCGFTNQTARPQAPATVGLAFRVNGMMSLCHWCASTTWWFFSFFPLMPLCFFPSTSRCFGNHSTSLIFVKFVWLNDLLSLLMICFYCIKFMDSVHIQKMCTRFSREQVSICIPVMDRNALGFMASWSSSLSVSLQH